MTPYTLGTGFFGDREKLAGMNIWQRCLHRNIQQAPEAVLIAAVGRQFGDWVHLERIMPWPKPQAVNLKGNLGHVGDLLNGTKKHQLCGWSAGFLTLAMQAYMNETDFLYVEQDVIVKGDVLNQVLEDLGDGQWIFGKAHSGPPWMPCGQSLVYVRRDFILNLVREYIALGDDGKAFNLPESKFARIEEMFPETTKRLSFGYDREKVNFDAPVWYCQHQTPEDRDEAIKRSLA